MIVEDQSAATEFMKVPSAHGLTMPVDTIETHISRIFLAGDRAYKMKRAVKLPYADFSTPALRLAACEKEVELNSRTAPGLYLGVRRITREKDGQIAFDGSGAMIDAVVEMVRFDQKCLFDRMAVAGEAHAEADDRSRACNCAFSSDRTHCAFGQWYREHGRRARNQ